MLRSSILLRTAIPTVYLRGSQSGILKQSNLPHHRCNVSKVDSPDVRKLAEMAQIEVSDQEVDAWQPQIAEIVEWFAHLQDLDLPADPSGSPEGSPLTDSRLREDTPRDWPEREKLLDEAPDREGRFVKVPKIL
ncbi:hypothetical protein WJX74_002182 [Apatococcus lobatus]|uniref:Glu-AdT subunit C n=1 Tax=Apatococcus lobatus TaxID=904363 RepID=A0AAW1S332_9CHLO